MKFLSKNDLVDEFKDTLLGALAQYTFEAWLRDKNIQRYGRKEHLETAWTQFRTLYTIAVGYERSFGSATAYMDERDALLDASLRVFQNNPTPEDWKVFDRFAKWLCVGTTLTPKIILKRVHISQYEYGLKMLGCWSDEYKYVSGTNREQDMLDSLQPTA